MAICVLIPTYCRLADKGRKENSEKLERRRGNPNVAEHCCKEKKKRRTRLSYNCAHLRWTKETQTIEYFRIVLKKDLGDNFLGEIFFGSKFLG